MRWRSLLGEFKRPIDPVKYSLLLIRICRNWLVGRSHYCTMILPLKCVGEVPLVGINLDKADRLFTSDAIFIWE